MHFGSADLYGLLRVKPEATAQEIKKAYRNLALKLHPDVNQASNSKEADLFKKITEAYNILSNPRLRRDYDYERTQRKIYSATTSVGRRTAQEAANTPYDFESWYKHHYAAEERKARMHKAQRQRPPVARTGSIFGVLMAGIGIAGLWSFNIHQSITGNLK